MLALDGIRGIAAVMVMLFHLRFLVGDPTSHIPDLARRVPPFVSFSIHNYGHLGVAVFFVLSGFVTAHSISGYRPSGWFWIRFCGRRLVRLTPPYYFAIAFAIGVAMVSAVANRQGLILEGKPLTVGRLLAHLVYAQESLHQSEISSVFWTLCFELVFYVVFVGLSAAAFAVSELTERDGYRRVFAPVAVIALACSLGQVQKGFGPFPWLGTFATFLLGAAVYNASRSKISWKTVIGFGVLYVAGGAVSDAAFKIAAGLTALLLGLAVNGVGMDRWLRGRVFQFFGKVSYSLYLTHSVVFSACFFVVSKFLGTGMAAQVSFVAVGPAASMLVAWVMWAIVEQPSARWARRIPLGKRVGYEPRQLRGRKGSTANSSEVIFV
jgi:peptidoglycan/LPS O-acetylase OafA/YrhL